MLHKFLVKYLSISQKMSNFAPVFEKTLKKYYAGYKKYRDYRAC